MRRPTISGISPLFIVADVPAARSFCRDSWGWTRVGSPSTRLAKSSSAVWGGSWRCRFG